MRTGLQQAAAHVGHCAREADLSLSPACLYLALKKAHFSRYCSECAVRESLQVMSCMRKIVSIVGVAILLAGGGSASAISLGKMRGAALLGQGLDLHVPLQLAPEEDIASLCLAAEVLYGDAPVDPTAVLVRALPGANAGASAQVQVTRPVDEPVVTLYVRAGCHTPVARKYVLLAEFLSEVQAPVRMDAQAVGLPAVVDTARAAVAPASAPRATAPVRVAGQASASVRRRSPASPVEAAPPVSRPVQAKAPTVGDAAPAPRSSVQAKSAQRGPRLTLTPLDLSQDWEPMLRISSQLELSEVPVDEARRREAQALWRVLQASPEDILRDADQRVALEKELVALQQASRTNQQAIAELSTRLRQAQEGRMANPTVYVLLILLVACGAILGLRERARRSGDAGAPWWAGASQAPATTAHGAKSQSLFTEQGVPSVPPVSRTPTASAGMAPAAAGPTSVPPTGALGTAPQGRSHSGFKHSDFAHSVTGALRSINTQEMSDVRQQADFFLALGQHDEAVSLLNGALQSSSDANPHIYLDLLDLFHRLGRKDDYERLGLVFAGRYTCLVPQFGSYGQDSRGLMDYPDIAMVIANAWPGHHALEFIEECLVREMGDAPGNGFALEAFRELLLLHGMLTTAGLLDDAQRPPAAAPAYRVLPLAQESGFLGGGTGGAASKPGPTLDIDLDLS